MVDGDAAQGPRVFPIFPLPAPYIVVRRLVCSPVDFNKRFGFGRVCFCDDVNDPAKRPAPVQCRSGPLEYLDPLDLMYRDQVERDAFRVGAQHGHAVHKQQNPASRVV